MSTKPIFTDLGLDEDLAAALRDRKIVHPFPIQEATLPLALKGHDIIGQARTGTGKTLAFGLPLLQRIDPNRAETQAIVIVPTRELCIQVADDLTVGAQRGITSIAVYGGVGYDEQIEALTTGVHVVVGTPGRTLDHLGRGNLDVSKIHTVVLDEADEMLDMGFLPDVERLLVDVPEQRQTLLFSATMPTAIVKLARRFMDKPTFMRADEAMHETDPNVDQYFFLVHRMDKPRVLARLLQMPGRGGAFVFCRTKRMCDRLVQELEPLGVSAIPVHGDLRQSSRERNLDRFRDGKADVLVATEVAARGLDVSNVTHVVNYDCPDDEKMYLHRIGRTARAGESGVAVTFGEFNEVDRVNVIRKRVAVEEEMMEVFSTSDELTKLFDLPETTPWDQLGDGGNSSRSSGSGGRPKKSSSGSNRSSGRGGKGAGSRRTSAATKRRREGGSDGASRRSRSSSSDKDSRSRSRSRTHSRTATEAAVADAVESRDDTPAAPSKSRDRSSNRSGGSDKKDSGDSGRTRARSRARRDRSHQSDNGASKSTGRSRARGGNDRDDDASRNDNSRKDNSRNDNSRNDNRRNDNRGKGKGQESDNSGNGKGRNRGNRSSGTGNRGGRSREATNRARNDAHDGDSTTRGQDARGDGTPRPRRRVAVEHLP